MSDDHRSLNQIIDFRKEKLAKLRDGGVEPYPQKYEPTHFSADILGDFENLEKQDVNIADGSCPCGKWGRPPFFISRISKGGSRSLSDGMMWEKIIMPISNYWT